MGIDPNISIFCNNVSLLRQTNGLSLREMASIMGIGIYSLRKIEAGILPPRMPVDVLFHLSRSFGIPAHMLMASVIGKPEDD